MKLREFLGLKRMGMSEDDLFRQKSIRQDDEFRWVLSQLSSLSPDSVLDVGCGAGHLLNIVSDVSGIPNVYGVDVNRQLIKLANDIKKANVVVGDVYDLPFKANVFQLIIMSNLLHHLHNVPKAMKEIRRTTANGKFIIIEQCVESLLTSVLVHIYTKILSMISGKNWTVRFLTPTELKRLFFPIIRTDAKMHRSRFIFKFIRIYIVAGTREKVNPGVK